MKALTRNFRSSLEDISLTAIATVTATITLGWTIPGPELQATKGWAEAATEATEVIKKAEVGQVEVSVRDNQDHQAVREEDNRSTLVDLQEQQTLPILVRATIIQGKSRLT